MQRGKRITSKQGRKDGPIVTALDGDKVFNHVRSPINFNGIAHVPKCTANWSPAHPATFFFEAG